MLHVICINPCIIHKTNLLTDFLYFYTQNHHERVPPMNLIEQLKIDRRRALLLAGAGLGSLGLAACGGGNKTAEQESSSSSSASETSQDSNSTTPSASGEASNTPDPNFSKGYSGGEKAPEGEYRMADYQGPAQNVPKPPMPTATDGHTEASFTGLRKSMLAWQRWRNYGMQTGDYSVALQFIGENCEDERKTITYVTELYEKGGWVIDGIQDIEYSYQPYIYGENYLWKIETKWLGVVYIQPDGQQIPQENLRTDDDTFWLECRHGDRGWYINSLLTPDEYSQKYKNQEKK